MAKGRRFTNCIRCGKRFEQEEISATGYYTTFKQCPSCREAEKPAIEFVMDYEPHETQKKVHESNARYKILICGARWGKDLCAIADSIMRFVEMLSENRTDDTLNPKVHWWIIAPTKEMAAQNWRDLKKLLPQGLIEKVQESDMHIYTIGEGLISVKSAFDADSLVGMGVDIATITEAARVQDLEETWANVQARLGSPGRGPHGNGGLAIINSTPTYINPKSNSFLYKLYCMGDKENQNFYNAEFESFHFTTWDNPYMGCKRYKNINVDKDGRPIGKVVTFEQSVKQQMTTEKYRQDYLGEFVFSGNAVFKNIGEILVRPPSNATDTVKQIFWDDIAVPIPNQVYTIGYDPASKNDGSPMVVFDSNGNMVHCDPMSSLSYEQQVNKLSQYSRKYNNAIVRYGSAGVGEVIGTLFRQKGVPAVEVREQGSNKSKLVEHAMLLMETKKVTILDRYDIYNQLSGYVRKPSPTGSTVTYENGMGQAHDDWVSAIYIALSGYGEIKDRAPFFGGFF